VAFFTISNALEWTPRDEVHRDGAKRKVLGKKRGGLNAPPAAVDMKRKKQKQQAGRTGTRQHLGEGERKNSKECQALFSRRRETVGKKGNNLRIWGGD